MSISHDLGAVALDIARKVVVADHTTAEDTAAARKVVEGIARKVAEEEAHIVAARKVAAVDIAAVRRLLLVALLVFLVLRRCRLA